MGLLSTGESWRYFLFNLDPLRRTSRALPVLCTVHNTAPLPQKVTSVKVSTDQQVAPECLRLGVAMTHDERGMNLGPAHTLWPRPHTPAGPAVVGGDERRPGACGRTMRSGNLRLFRDGASSFCSALMWSQILDQIRPQEL